MKIIKDIILNTNFEEVSKEIKIHYGDRYIYKIKDVFEVLCKLPHKNNQNNMVTFIRVLKESVEFNEDIVVNDFDNDDSSLMFDVCGEDDQYDGIYSIASSNYDELLGYYVDQSTIEKFTNSQFVAHLLYEIQWLNEKDIL